MNPNPNKIRGLDDRLNELAQKEIKGISEMYMKPPWTSSTSIYSDSLNLGKSFFETSPVKNSFGNSTKSQRTQQQQAQEQRIQQTSFTNFNVTTCSERSFKIPNNLKNSLHDRSLRSSNGRDSLIMPPPLVPSMMTKGLKNNQRNKDSGISSSSSSNFSRAPVNLYNWRVALDVNWNIILTGTTETETFVLTKPIRKRISMTVVETATPKVTYNLQGSIVDEEQTLPEYISKKFTNGFPDDWENVIQVWSCFMKSSSRTNFRWPTTVDDSEDEIQTVFSEAISTTSLVKTRLNQISLLRNMCPDLEKTTQESTISNHNSSIMKPYGTNYHEKCKIANRVFEALHEHKVELIIEKFLSKDCPQNYANMVEDLLNIAEKILVKTEIPQTNQTIDESDTEICGVPKIRADAVKWTNGRSKKKPKKRPRKSNIPEMEEPQLKFDVLGVAYMDEEDTETKIIHSENGFVSHESQEEKAVISNSLEPKNKAHKSITKIRKEEKELPRICQNEEVQINMKIKEMYGMAKNPKLLKNWKPILVFDENFEMGQGLVFEGLLLNESRQPVQKKYRTDFIVQRNSSKLLKTLAGEFVSLMGNFSDKNHDMPKAISRQFQKGCPPNIQQLCRTWKKELEKGQTSQKVDLDCSFSKRGRMIMPTTNYWEGDRK